MKVWMVILQGFECLVKTQKKKKETLNINGKSLVSPVSPDFSPKSKLSHQPKKDILFTKKIVKKHWFEWYPPQKKMAFPVVACHLRYLSTAKRRVESGEDDVVPSLVQLQVLVLQKKQQQRWPSRSSAAVAVSLKQRRLAKWATEEQVPNPGLLPSTQFSANSQLTKT